MYCKKKVKRGQYELFREQLKAVVRHWDYNMHCVSALNIHTVYPDKHYSNTTSDQRYCIEKVQACFYKVFSRIHHQSLGIFVLLHCCHYSDYPWLFRGDTLLTGLLWFFSWIGSVSGQRETLSKPLTQGLHLSEESSGWRSFSFVTSPHLYFQVIPHA